MIREQQVSPLLFRHLTIDPRQSRDAHSRSRSHSPEKIGSHDGFAGEPSLSTLVSLDSKQVTDEIIRNLGAEMIGNRAPQYHPKAPLRSLKKRLVNANSRSHRPRGHQLVSDITDESEYESESFSAFPRDQKQASHVTFNAPRVWRGEYSSPRVVNLLDEIALPSVSPLIAAFHSVRLKVERKVTQGVFLRSSDKAPPPNRKAERESEEHGNATARDIYAQSVVTKHLIGRSTWDRVVGMHSEFARSFIASKLKDTRLVFVVNTAGTEHPQRTPLPLEEEEEEQRESLHRQSRDFFSSLREKSSPSPPVDRIPVTQMHPPISDESSSVSALEPVPSFASGQLNFAIHEPTTPKPSFSPRKRTSARLNPSVLVPLT
jgi:hypothetical protein